MSSVSISKLIKRLDENNKLIEEQRRQIDKLNDVYDELISDGLNKDASIRRLENKCDHLINLLQDLYKAMHIKYEAFDDKPVYAETSRKQQLMCQYRPLCYVVQGNKHRVCGFDKKSCDYMVVEDLKDAEECDWYYLYGPNNKRACRLDRHLLYNGVFAEGDKDELFDSYSDSDSD